MCEEEERLQYAAAHGLIDLADCIDRFDDPLWNFRYLRNSVYSAEDRFRAIFGAARVKAILLEEFVANPGATLSSVAAFLDIDPAGFPRNLDLHCNATALMRALMLVGVLQRLPGRDLLRRIPGYNQNRRALYRRPLPPDPAVKDRFRRLFAPELKRLEVMLGRDLAAIWGSN